MTPNNRNLNGLGTICGALSRHTQELHDLLELMGIPTDQLKTALMIRNVYWKPFKCPVTYEKAKESTDAFAQDLFVVDATCAKKNYQKK